MAFFKLKFRNKSPPANSIFISKPVAVDPQQQTTPDDRSSPFSLAMDHDNRRSPPTPLKLRGNYHTVNTVSSMKRVPSSPLPPLPSYDSGDDFGSHYSDGELGYSRGVARFERVRRESDDTTRMLSPPAHRSSRTSSEMGDTLSELAPLSNSPPKLKLSFESNITEAGSMYDLDTPPNHRVSLNSAFKAYSNPSPRTRGSPERIITSPPKNAITSVTTIEAQPR